MRVSLIRQMQLAGIRRGFRIWRTLTSDGGVPPDRLPEVRLYHGDKPRLPGYGKK